MVEEEESHRSYPPVCTVTIGVPSARITELQLSFRVFDVLGYAIAPTRSRFLRHRR